jgi:rhamnosyl/mannosyltransferase
MSHYAAMSLPPEVKLVVTWHSDIVRQQKALVFYRPFLKTLMRRASAIIGVVPFGFDLQRYQVPHPKAAEIREKVGRKIVFALGRHVYYKGFDVLIRAMKDVPDACLLLGGTGPLLEEHKRLAGDNVHFVGRIPDEDLPAYYQACDVYCLPSTEPSEAFGIVQVEAMAAGKPVICTDLRNGVNWVNPDGPTVPPRDPVALAGAIKEVLRNPPATKNLERAKSLFSLEALRIGTLAVYREALDSGSVPELIRAPSRN